MSLIIDSFADSIVHRDMTTRLASKLQSVDSHGLWGGLTEGLQSTLGSARSRFERDRTSLRCPPHAALSSV